MYHFIVNLNSRTGKARKIWEELRQELERREVLYVLHETKYAGHAIEISRKLVKTTDETVKVTLSIGGSGSGSKIENVYNDNAHDIRGKGYEVISVSGYVIVD